jgi:intracellular multiplication protein IcmT
MSSVEDTEVEKQNWHWRNTMRPVRFFNLDARAGLAFFILLFYFRIHTLILTIMITFLFRFLESKGLTFPASLRAFRVWFIGDGRPGLLSYRHRSMKDYG